MLPQSTAFIKKENQKKIKNAIKHLGIATKKDVSELANLSFSTCNNLINLLVESEELLVLKDTVLNETGRPSFAYQINSMHTLMLCILLEKADVRDCVTLMLTDIYGSIIKEQVFTFDKISIEMLIEVSADFGQGYSNIGIVGVSVPGVVNSDGKILESTMHGLDDVNISEMLSAKLGVPTLAENDMNLIAYGMDGNAMYGEMGSVVVLSNFKGAIQGSGMVVNGQM